MRAEAVPVLPEGYDARVFWRRQRRRADELIRSPVVVHTKDKKSIAGVLMDVYEDGVVLKAARLLSEDAGVAIPLDGEILIPWRNYSFSQAGIIMDDTRSLAAAARGVTGVDS